MANELLDSRDKRPVSNLDLEEYLWGRILDSIDDKEEFIKNLKYSLMSETSDENDPEKLMPIEIFMRENAYYFKSLLSLKL